VGLLTAEFNKQLANIDIVENCNERVW